MRIGISTPLQHTDAISWARQMKELGCGAVIFPVDYRAPDNVIADYADAAKNNDLIIAEVGIWRNVMSSDAAEREAARKHAEGQLRLADEIGALCCVNITGTYGGPQWDGGYRENFSRECWDSVVAYTQDLIDTVKPVHTKYTPEPMPWMIPTGPEEFIRLMQDVDREAFGIHLDFVNMINCPERYFNMDSFMDHCFEIMGPYLCSCHIKDILLNGRLTFQLIETSCGNGVLNIEKYCGLINKYDPEMPVIIEHLHSDEEYRNSLEYVRTRLEKTR